MMKKKPKIKKHKLSDVVETFEYLIDDGGVSEPTVAYKTRVDRITSDLFDIEEKTNGKISRLKNEFGEEILKIDGDIPIGLEPKNHERYLFISYDQSVLTHGLHKYPAKFFPELPRWIIKKYSTEGDWVLDPFSGSATTNIECLLNKRHSVGIDIDPFSRFIAKAKTTPLNTKCVTEAYLWLKDQLRKFNNQKIKESDILHFPYRDN